MSGHLGSRQSVSKASQDKMLSTHTRHHRPGSQAGPKGQAGEQERCGKVGKVHDVDELWWLVVVMLLSRRVDVWKSTREGEEG